MVHFPFSHLAKSIFAATDRRLVCRKAVLRGKSEYAVMEKPADEQFKPTPQVPSSESYV